MKMLGGKAQKKLLLFSKWSSPILSLFRTRVDIPSVALTGHGSKFFAFETCDVSTSKSPKQGPRNINKQFLFVPYPRVSLVNTSRRKGTQA